MKKYLKITLFIKVFLIILCGVLCIEGIHIYFDYDDNLRETVKTQILDNDIKRHEKILNLANKYALDIKLRDFEKEWKDIYGDWYGYRAVSELDDKFNIIYEQLRNDYYIYVRNEENQSYKLNINHFSESMTSEISTYVQKCYEKNPNEKIYLEIAMSEGCVPTGNDLYLDENTTVESGVNTDVLDYLKIGDIEYKKNNNQNISTYFLERLESPQILYSTYSPSGKAELEDFNILKENCRKVVKHEIDCVELGGIGETYYGYAFINNMLYVYVDSATIDNQKNYHYTDVIDTGYSKSEIIKSSLLQNDKIYMFSFIIVLCMSVLITLVVQTYRKKNEKMKNLVESHQFDTNSNDEL